MRPFNLVRSMLVVATAMLSADLINFSLAAAEADAAPFTLLSLAATLAALAVWFVQVRRAALACSWGFGIFTAVYWVLGFVCMLMLPLAVRTGAILLTSPAFIGLLMLYVPFYALLPLAGAAGVSYLWLYPPLFAALAGVYWQSYRKGMAMRAAAAEELAAQDEASTTAEEAAAIASDEYLSATEAAEMPG